MSISSITASLTGGAVGSAPALGAGTSGAAAAASAGTALGGSTGDGSVGLFDGVLKKALIHGAIGAASGHFLKFLPGGPILGGVMGAIGGAALQMFSNYRKIKKIRDTNAALLGAAGVQPLSQAEANALLAGDNAALQTKVGQVVKGAGTAGVATGAGTAAATPTAATATQTDPFSRVPMTIDSGGAYLAATQDTSWIKTTDGTAQVPAAGGTAGQFAAPLVTVVDGTTQPTAAQVARNPVMPLQGAEAQQAAAAAGGGPTTPGKRFTVHDAADRARAQARLRARAAAERESADERRRVDEQAAYERSVARHAARLRA